jgi:hypothetical protein
VEAFESEKKIYLVQELMRGPTLYDRFAQNSAEDITEWHVASCVQKIARYASDAYPLETRWGNGVGFGFGATSVCCVVLANYGRDRFLEVAVFLKLCAFGNTLGR